MEKNKIINSIENMLLKMDYETLKAVEETFKNIIKE